MSDIGEMAEEMYAAHNPVAVHLNRTEYEQIVNMQYPKDSPLREMADVVPGLLERAEAEEAENATLRERALALWGTGDIGVLFGVPIVAEEDLEHWWVETA